MKNLKQLTLNLCLKDTASFANFFIGKNDQLIKLLTSFHTTSAYPFLYFWGALGCGKTHLLSALCQLFSEHHLAVAYLPLEDLSQLNIKMLDELETFDLLCIDDLQLIGGNLAWEEQVFHCFNSLLAHNKKIVITADTAPATLPLQLLDLKSRMMSGLVFAVHALSDEEKILSLKLRAKLRGLELNDGAASFLLNHYERDTKSLFIALEFLDKAALMAKRRLTIPFIKDILNSDNL